MDHSCIGVQHSPVKFRCSHRNAEAIIHQTVWSNTGMRNLQCLDKQASTVPTKNGAKMLGPSVSPRSLLQAVSEALGSTSCCCSRHFLRTTTHLHPNFYWKPESESITGTNHGLEPCPTWMLRALTVLQPFGQLLGSAAAPGGSELLGSRCCTPMSLHVEWEGQTSYVLYESGITHGLLSTWAEF